MALAVSLVLGLLVMSMASSAVFAASESEKSISGKLSIANVAPEVTAIAVTTMADVPEDNLDPQTNYKFKVSVTDNNTLVDISTLELKLYYDNILLPDDRRDHYTFKFTAPSTWEEIGPDTDERHLVTGSCVAPADNTQQSGTYVFVVKFDVIAKPTALNKWDAYAKATDDNGLTDELTDENKFDVNDYISLTVEDDNLTFSGSPGEENVEPAEQPTVATVDTNVDFHVQCKVDNWVGSSSTIGADNTKAAQTAAHDSEITLSTGYNNLWTNVGYGESVARDIYWFLNVPISASDSSYTTTFYVKALKGD